MKKRVGYYVAKAARKYFNLPEPEPGDILRSVVRRRLQEMKIKNRPNCGAKTRAGHPCCNRVVVRSDGTLAARCRMHGGHSTGARTVEGKERVAEANRRRAQARAEAAST